MKVAEVKDRVERIRVLALVDYDYEVAHAEEDSLRDDVLQAIAAGSRNAKSLATAALATGEYEFPRWCA